MNKQFEISKITRNNILKAVQSLSDEQLVKIPQGYNNNILWNMGHIVGSGQKLTYGMSGVPMRISEEFPAVFAKGSSPKEWKSTPDIKQVKEYLSTTSALLEEDYNKGIFNGKPYKEYETSYGFIIMNVNDAISFCNVHDAVHFGIIMALKKMV